MIPELFTVGPLTVSSFSVMLMLAFIVPTLLLYRELGRVGLDPDLASGIVIAAAIGGLVGARIYYVLERWDRLLIDPAPLLFSRIGLVWYGGLIGGAIAVVWYVRRKGISPLLIADLLAPLLALGQVFGRMGCLLSGDGDYGPPSDVPWAMSFPNGVVPTNEQVHPTPIYDALILLGIFGLLWKTRTKEWPPGARIGLYLVLIGVGRFFTEFYRTTPEVFAGLTFAQLISVGLALIGAMFMLAARSGRTARA